MQGPNMNIMKSIIMRIVNRYKRTKRNSIENGTTFIFYVLNTIKSMIKNSINTKIRNWISKAPLKNIILLESMNGLDSNVGSVFNEMIKQEYNKKYKMVWLVDDVKKFKKIKIKNVYFQKIYSRRTLEEYSNIFRAKYIIWEDKEIEKVREKQVSIYLTHGMPGGKNVKGIINLPSDIDYVLCTSENIRLFLADMISCLPEKLFICGMPRTDGLFEKKYEIEKAIGIKNFNKIIVWMPTFRQFVSGRNDSNREYELGIPIFSDTKAFEELNKTLSKWGVLLIIKPHPRQDLNKLKISNTENIRILVNNYFEENNINLYSLLGCSDALITDYSSVTYEYLLLDKPLAFTEDDLENYKLTIIENAYLPDNAQELLKPGKRIKTDLEFLAFIGEVAREEDEYKGQREETLFFMHEYKDFNNSSRFLSIMKDKIGL